LPPTSDDLGVLADRTRHSSCDPHEQAELNQIAALVHEALRSFAEQGPTQARQAWLVRCRVFDELSYAELAERTACSSGALRVRIHKALQALRRHIETHPELAELLGCTAGRQRT
jgi:DNA-directed RNA polymerase specialized sigma24 family protein